MQTAPLTDDSLPKPPNEQWNILSVRSSGLQPEAPLIGEVDDLPGFKREFIMFKWSWIT
jgi:hypothetical protein